MPTDLKRFEFIAYFVGAYVADVVLKSRRKDMSPEEIAMIVDRALDNLRGRDGVKAAGIAMKQPLADEGLTT